MRTLSVRAKLVGGFALVVAMLAITSVTAVRQLSAANDRTDEVADEFVPAAAAVGDMNAALFMVRSIQADVVAGGQPMLKTFRPIVADQLAASAKAIKQLDATSDGDGADGVLLTRFKRSWTTYLARTEPVLDHVAAGDIGGAAKALNAPMADFEASIAQLEQVRKERMGDLAESRAAASDAAAGAKRLVIILALVGLVLAAAVAFVLSRGIVRTVAVVIDRLRSLREQDTTDLRHGLEAMAGGDLTIAVEPATEPIEHVTRDELGQVATAVNAIRENTVASLEAYNDTRRALSAMIGEVQATASTVSASSQQVAATSEAAGRTVDEIAGAVSEVAEGASRQAHTADVTREATTEMVGVTAQSAERAQQSAEAASEALAVARDGADAVAQATQAMAGVRSASEDVTRSIRQLGTKSEQIGGIVDAITGIAEQTNLLALNAAIEAARAGEQGRGFAVVAEEVRKLAEESQTAAASIAGLIGEIQADTATAVRVVEQSAVETERGAETVEQARGSFQRIGEGVERMTAQVGEIASAVQQLAASSQRVSDGIAEVAAVAEETSATSQQVSASAVENTSAVREIAGSAQDLASAAAELERLVARFTVTA